jgi:hypothetical protein
VRWEAAWDVVTLCRGRLFFNVSPEAMQWQREVGVVGGVGVEGDGLSGQWEMIAPCLSSACRVF